MSTSKKVPTHRGRTKDGKVAITIHLSPEEVESLNKVAEAECRSRTMQAIWFVLQGMREYPKEGADSQGRGRAGAPQELQERHPPLLWG